MKKIERILVPTDFSDTAQNAMRYALWFASHYGAEIHVLHTVYPEHVQMDLPTYSAQATADKVEAAKAAMQAFVSTAREKVRPLNLPDKPSVTTDVIVGSAAGVIADYAKENEVDLIIMGTREQHHALERVFGSVTTALIRKSPTAVMAIPAHVNPKDINTVGYATDLSEDDPLHIWECGKVLEPFNPFIYVVHVHTPDQKAPLKMQRVEDFFADNAPALQISFHEVEGEDVDSELNEFVDTHHLDLLIMHTRRRNIFERLSHKSHTKWMALYGSVPILITK